MPRFVILKHDHPNGLHYDFMLEMGKSLKTWTLAEPPAIGIEQSAKLLPDHRIAYLDYEGTVSNNRGSVTRWDKGTFQIIEQTEKSLTVELFGEKIRGKANFVKQRESLVSWEFLLRGGE